MVTLIYLVVKSYQVGIEELSRLIQENQDLTKEQTEECMLFHSAWNSLAKTWTLPVIHALGLKQPARFNELKRRIHGISATSLAERLHELEQRKIIERKVYPETPPRVEYALTRKGLELHELLGKLGEWVRKWDRPRAAVAEQPREQVKPIPHAR
jgi:DNA-binding HxlR family transcriptional regulator